MESKIVYVNTKSKSIALQKLHVPVVVTRYLPRRYVHCIQTHDVSRGNPSLRTALSLFDTMAMASVFYNQNTTKSGH